MRGDFRIRKLIDLFTFFYEVTEEPESGQVGTHDGDVAAVVGSAATVAQLTKPRDELRRPYGIAGRACRLRNSWRPWGRLWWPPL
ncbi:hypothetical protein MRX96_011268 [Rhipicephalus microplus]